MTEYEKFIEWVESQTRYELQKICDADYQAGMWKAWQAAKRAAK